MMRVSNSSKSNGSAERLAPIFLFILFMSALGILNGCGTLSNGRGWGQDATWNPGWARIKSATIDAALSPETWGTVAAALVLQIDDMDERISDWASDNTPIFGSQNNADKWSDYLRDTSGAAYLLTTLVTPSGEDPLGWSTSKVKGLTVGAIAWGFTAGTTELLKDQTERTRPDKSDNRSFPSGHVSSAGSFTTLGRRNISCLSLSPAYEKFSNLALYGISAGTAWARVEAKKHYPSDALVGYAIGHFSSALINDAFLGLDTKKGPFFAIEPSRHGMLVNLNWIY
jgi:membrane-associated phospholipid phosphatase